MKFSEINFFCACVVGLVLINPVHNAPRSRSKNRTTIKYNQQQSGEVNVQVHLKDFHIIALLGDDSWGGAGDYDYNYDYSDLTIKPILAATTVSPQGSTNISDISDVDLIKPEVVDTEKPSDHPYSIELPSTTQQALENVTSTTLKPQQSTNAPSPSNDTVLSGKIPVMILNPEKTSQLNSTTQKPNPSPEIPEQKVPQKTTKLEDSEEVTEKKTESSVTNISIVPAENSGVVQNEQHLPLGEIMHYRKCSEGYARDKQGRCRKNRWAAPHLPFGLSRFASSLASRFRQGASGKVPERS